MTRDPATTAIWLFIILWTAVWSGIVVVGAVAVLAWLIAQSVEALVGFAMWMGGV